jgi:hypothetical protein
MSETGHALNVARLQEMISRIVGFGAPYNPSNVAITLAALQTKLSDSNAVMDGVMSALNVWIAKVNQREVDFALLRPLVTRIVNYFGSTGAEDNEVADARALKRKIDGRRASKKPVPTPDDPNAPVPKINSFAQTSFTEEIEHFDALVDMMLTHPLYVPNEVDLQKDNLHAVSTTLHASDTAVIDAYTAITNKRKDRQAVLYADKTGLFDLAGLVKRYVKGLFGGASPEFKQLSKLRFKKIT